MKPVVLAENNASGFATQMAAEFAEEGSDEYDNYYERFYREKVKEQGTEVVGLDSEDHRRLVGSVEGSNRCLA